MQLLLHSMALSTNKVFWYCSGPSHFCSNSQLVCRREVTQLILHSCMILEVVCWWPVEQFLGCGHTSGSQKHCWTIHQIYPWERKYASDVGSFLMSYCTITIMVYTLSTSAYCKSTYTDIYLNFDSHTILWCIRLQLFKLLSWEQMMYAPLIFPLRSNVTTLSNTLAQ